jgi:hypothetical protein
VALLQAWHFEGLLKEYPYDKLSTKLLKDFAELALRRLEDPQYMNASLFECLKHNAEKIQRYVTRFRK